MPAQKTIITRSLAAAAAVLLAGAALRGNGVFYVAPDATPAGDGSEASPWTIRAAQQHVRALDKNTAGKLEVRLLPGVYALDEPLVFSSEDSGAAQTPVVWKPAGRNGNVNGGAVIFSGGRDLGALAWEPWRNGIWRARVPVAIALPDVVDRLFVNGVLQVWARYPNYSAKAPYLNGVAADVDSPERVARWKNPAGAYIHALHKGLWGGFHYKITGKNADGTLALEGGWQNNRPEQGPNLQMRYVEGVFEELDAPGEWYFDRAGRWLYFYPPPGVDLKSPATRAVVARLESLVRFEGAHDVAIEGVTFAHTARTFMKTREPLVRSDWRIYRGGAVFFEGAQDCAVRDCEFDAPGGNAVFVSNRNLRIAVESCYIHDAGASGVVFAGGAAAARSALFHYGDTQPPEKIDRSPGPRTDDFPHECVVRDCLITRIGRVEKQSAGVSIDLAARITVKNCTIHDAPRAGINIGDGCWGGHLIEGNDVFDTVLETSDHGAFNSWGRDRFWERTRKLTEQWVRADPGLPFLDAGEPGVIRGNRFRCDHGWDIDLDDGSTNYVIENNLCLAGGIKLREGYRRTVRNNITVNNGLHPHVWYRNSGDVVTNNIFCAPYAPIGMPDAWGGEAGAGGGGAVFDNNFLHKPGASGTAPAVELQKRSGQDSRSLEGDARFIAPLDGGHGIAPDSPALKTGFCPFDTKNFGVISPRLRALARAPQFSPLEPARETAAAARAVRWDGATVKNLTTPAEQSAAGMMTASGVLVLNVGKNAQLEKLGVLPRDVILSWGKREIHTVGELLDAAKKDSQPPEIKVWRNQEIKHLGH